MSAGRTILSCVTIGLLIWTLTGAEGRLVGNGLEANSLFRQLSQILDDKQIDVRSGAPGPEASPRPELFDLAHFPIDDNLIPAASHFNPLFFASQQSDSAFLVAVDAPGEPVPTSELMFKASWDASPFAKRVFVSFSGKDYAVAHEVYQALHSLGYISFIYSNVGTAAPRLNIVETATYFAEAKAHFVIDTRNARGSPAVNAEAYALKFRAVPRLWSIPKPAPSEPCCRLCQKRGSIIEKCGPKICGYVTCAKAR